MSETLKFGNGQFATKEGSTLAYNDENGNFKPLPFTFDRSTSATRVNKEDLIEVVSNNEPRIDFLNDSKGALLLEPSRSNLNDYSEDGTQWGSINTTVSLDNSISKPDGVLGAYKVTDDTKNGQHRVDVSSTVVNGTQYTFSAFVKQAENSDVDFIYLLFTTKFQTLRIRFNLSNGTAIGSDGTIENYGNGWYRVSGTATANADGNGLFGVNLMNADTGATYAGTGNGAMYVYGIQVEQGSYATSYIPTQGSIGTRVAENITQTTPNLSNSQDVTFFIDLDERPTTGQNTTANNIRLDFGSGNTRVIYNKNTSDQHRIELNIGGVASYYTVNVSVTTRAKIGVSLTPTTLVIYSNGLEKYSVSISNADWSNLLAIETSINEAVGNIKINDLRFYNTALTDQELQVLTTI